MGKSVYEVAERGLGWVGDSTWFMGKGIEFIGKVKEAWILHGRLEFRVVKNRSLPEPRQ